jgi:hypothetical protein
MHATFPVHFMLLMISLTIFSDRVVPRGVRAEHEAVYAGPSLRFVQEKIQSQ